MNIDIFKITMPFITYLYNINRIDTGRYIEICKIKDEGEIIEIFSNLFQLNSSYIRNYHDWMKPYIKKENK
jgi:hypothetical protein